MQGLSILIANYHWDITDFVKQLHQQVLSLNIPFEIIGFDDASHFPQKEDINKLPNTFYSVLMENVGRAKNRNLLAEKARYDWLLFLDGDSMTLKEDFLKKYWDLALLNEQNTIFCGGTAYEISCKDTRCEFHWKYGIEKEIKDELGFKSNNFFLNKLAFNKVKFDENIKDYGYEDLIFGIQALEKGIKIQRIENRLLHLGLNENKDFVNKSIEGSLNLRKLYALGKIQSKDSKLIAFDRKIGKWKPVFLFVMHLFHPIIKWICIQTKNLVLLDFIKWYWFAQDRR
ncbi:MAG: glycosyltransferase [Flavobacteriales bacterium]|jgi:hypothetical protein|nr:glycosyltransferase [Flavobacteriales bacterium]